MNKELINDALQISLEAGRLSQCFVRLIGKCSDYDDRSIRAGAEKIEVISISAAEIAERLLYPTGKEFDDKLSQMLDEYSDDLVIWRALYEDILNKTESEGKADGCYKSVS